MSSINKTGPITTHNTGKKIKSSTCLNHKHLCLSFPTQQKEFSRVMFLMSSLCLSRPVFALYFFKDWYNKQTKPPIKMILSLFNILLLVCLYFQDTLVLRLNNAQKTNQIPSRIIKRKTEIICKIFHSFFIHKTIISSFVLVCLCVCVFVAMYFQFICNHQHTDPFMRKYINVFSRTMKKILKCLFIWFEWG